MITRLAASLALLSLLPPQARVVGPATTTGPVGIGGVSVASFVKACANINAANATSVTCTMTSPVTAGHSLLLFTTTYGVNTVTVNGDAGTATTVVANQAVVGGNYSAILVVCNAVGSETVIGSTLGSSIDHSEVIVMEFANLPTTSCVDTSGTTASGNSTSLTSNSITPAANKEMLVGLFCYNGAPAFTIGTNVAWIYDSAKMLNSYAPNVSTTGAYYYQSTAAALTATGTIGVSTNWNALIVALK